MIFMGTWFYWLHFSRLWLRICDFSWLCDSQVLQLKIFQVFQQKSIWFSKTFKVSELISMVISFPRINRLVNDIRIEVLWLWLWAFSGLNHFLWLEVRLRLSVLLPPLHGPLLQPLSVDDVLAVSQLRHGLLEHEPFSGPLHVPGRFGTDDSLVARAYTSHHSLIPPSLLHVSFPSCLKSWTKMNVKEEQ